MPFSHDAFLDVFGRYNTLLWPLVAALWLATAGMMVMWLQRENADGRPLLWLIALHWLISGVAYHWFFFRAINPAAAAFAALFIVEAALLVWVTRLPSAARRRRFDARTVMGTLLIAYGLLYPALSLVFGLRYPRVPLFAVPCPTTLVTAGFLLAAGNLPRSVYVIPMLWALVGGTAAFALSVRADLMLFVAAGALAIDLFRPVRSPA